MFMHIKKKKSLYNLQFRQQLPFGAHCSWNYCQLQTFIVPLLFLAWTTTVLEDSFMMQWTVTYNPFGAPTPLIARCTLYYQNNYITLLVYIWTNSSILRIHTHTYNSLIRRETLLEYFNLLQAALGLTNIHEI